MRWIGTYFAKDVISINIPLGIEKINFANKNTTLQKLVITDNAVVTIVNFSKYSEKDLNKLLFSEQFDNKDVFFGNSVIMKVHGGVLYGNDPHG